MAMGWGGGVGGGGGLCLNTLADLQYYDNSDSRKSRHKPNNKNYTAEEMKKKQ